MKKTLVAVAALAASAAFAQSSVTLYGVADAYVGSQKAATGAKNQIVVNDGGLSQSRLGVSVKEDLGAGLSAFAVVEGAVALDTGAGGLGANRKSVVGLSGDFGAVSLGQQFTPARDVVENILDAQSNSAFSAVSSSMTQNATLTGVYAMTGGGDAYANSVRYDTPNFDGFSAAVQVASSEFGSRAISLNGKYENGPLALAIAHQDAKGAGKHTAVAGSYDFGAAKLNLGFQNRKFGVNDRNFNIGVTVPVDAFTIVAQYANDKVKNGARTNAFALEGRYALSKRTTAYAGLNATKVKNGNKTNRFGVGLRHVF